MAEKMESLTLKQIKAYFATGTDNEKKLSLRVLGPLLSSNNKLLKLVEKKKCVIDIINILKNNKNAEVQESAFWSLTQATSVDFDDSMLLDIVACLDTACQDTKSVGKCYEACNLIQRLLKEKRFGVEEQRIKIVSVSILRTLVHPVTKIREACFPSFQELYGMLSENQSLMLQIAQHLSSIIAKESFIKDCLLLVKKQGIYVLEVLDRLLVILGKELWCGKAALKLFIPILERAFKVRNGDDLKVAFTVWKTMIEVLSQDLSVLTDPRKIKFILQPVRIKVQKYPAALPAFQNAYWTLVIKLADKLPSYFEKLVIPLLEALLGCSLEETGTAVSSASNSQEENIAMIEIASQMLLRILETPLTPACSELTYPEKRPTLTIMALTVAVPATVLLHNFKRLIKASRYLMLTFGKNNENEPMLEVLFISLLNAASFAPDKTSKFCTEAMQLLLSLVEDVINHDLLTPDICLTYIKHFTKLPSFILTSHHCQLGHSTVMNNNLAVSLATLLLNPYVFCPSRKESRFRTTFKSLLDVSVLESSSALIYAQIFVNLISETKFTSMADSDDLLIIWCDVASPLLEVIKKTQDVNQGDSLENDFSCLYSTLLYPVMHFLPPEVSEETFKPALKYWTELYKSLIEYAPTVENNTCEEFCQKLKISIKKEFLQNEMYFGAICSMLNVIVSYFDLESLNTGEGSLDNENSQCGLNKKKPLGNMTTITNLCTLLLQSLCEKLSTPEHDYSKLQKDVMFEIPGLSKFAEVFSVIGNFACSFKNSNMIPALMSSIMKPLAKLFLMSSEDRSDDSQLTTKLRDLWDRISTTIVCHYQGSFDEALLKIFCPIFEATYKHACFDIVDASRALWSTTFAENQSSLKYAKQIKNSSSAWFNEFSAVERKMEINHESFGDEKAVSSPSGEISDKNPVRESSDVKISESNFENDVELEKEENSSINDKLCESDLKLYPDIHISDNFYPEQNMNTLDSKTNSRSSFLKPKNSSPILVDEEKGKSKIVVSEIVDDAAQPDADESVSFCFNMTVDRTGNENQSRFLKFNDVSSLDGTYEKTEEIVIGQDGVQSIRIDVSLEGNVEHGKSVSLDNISSEIESDHKENSSEVPSVSSSPNDSAINTSNGMSCEHNYFQTPVTKKTKRKNILSRRRDGSRLKSRTSSSTDDEEPNSQNKQQKSEVQNTSSGVDLPLLPVTCKVSEIASCHGENLGENELDASSQELFVDNLLNNVFAAEASIINIKNDLSTDVRKQTRNKNNAQLNKSSSPMDITASPVGITASPLNIPPSPSSIIASPSSVSSSPSSTRSLRHVKKNFSSFRFLNTERSPSERKKKKKSDILSSDSFTTSDEEGSSKIGKKLTYNIEQTKCASEEVKEKEDIKEKMIGAHVRTSNNNNSASDVPVANDEPTLKLKKTSTMETNITSFEDQDSHRNKKKAEASDEDASDTKQLASSIPEPQTSGSKATISKKRKSRCSLTRKKGEKLQLSLKSEEESKRSQDSQDGQNSLAISESSALIEDGQPASLLTSNSASCLKDVDSGETDEKMSNIDTELSVQVCHDPDVMLKPLELSPGAEMFLRGDILPSSHSTPEKAVDCDTEKMKLAGNIEDMEKSPESLLKNEVENIFKSSDIILSSIEYMDYKANVHETSDNEKERNTAREEVKQMYETEKEASLTTQLSSDNTVDTIISIAEDECKSEVVKNVLDSDKITVQALNVDSSSQSVVQITSSRTRNTRSKSAGNLNKNERHLELPNQKKKLQRKKRVNVTLNNATLCDTEKIPSNSELSSVCNESQTNEKLDESKDTLSALTVAKPLESEKSLVEADVLPIMVLRSIDSAQLQMNASPDIILHPADSEKDPSFLQKSELPGKSLHPGNLENDVGDQQNYAFKTSNDIKEVDTLKKDRQIGASLKNASFMTQPSSIDDIDMSSPRAELTKGKLEIQLEDDSGQIIAGVVKVSTDDPLSKSAFQPTSSRTTKTRSSSTGNLTKNQLHSELSEQKKRLQRKKKVNVQLHKKLGKDKLDTITTVQLMDSKDDLTQLQKHASSDKITDSEKDLTLLSKSNLSQNLDSAVLKNDLAAQQGNVYKITNDGTELKTIQKDSEQISAVKENVPVFTQSLSGNADATSTSQTKLTEDECETELTKDTCETELTKDKCETELVKDKCESKLIRDNSRNMLADEVSTTNSCLSKSTVQAVSSRTMKTRSLRTKQNLSDYLELPSQRKKPQRKKKANVTLNNTTACDTEDVSTVHSELPLKCEEPQNNSTVHEELGYNKDILDTLTVLMKSTECAKDVANHDPVSSNSIPCPLSSEDGFDKALMRKGGLSNIGSDSLAMNSETGSVVLQKNMSTDEVLHPVEFENTVTLLHNVTSNKNLDPAKETKGADDIQLANSLEASDVYNDVAVIETLNEHMKEFEDFECNLITDPKSSNIKTPLTKKRKRKTVIGRKKSKIQPKQKALKLEKDLEVHQDLKSDDSSANDCLTTDELPVLPTISEEPTMNSSGNMNEEVPSATLDNNVDQIIDSEEIIPNSQPLPQKFYDASKTETVQKKKPDKGHPVLTTDSSSNDNVLETKTALPIRTIQTRKYSRTTSKYEVHRHDASLLSKKMLGKKTKRCNTVSNDITCDVEENALAAFPNVSDNLSKVLVHDEMDIESGELNVSTDVDPAKNTNSDSVILSNEVICQAQTHIEISEPTEIADIDQNDSETSSRYSSRSKDSQETISLSNELPNSQSLSSETPGVDHISKKSNRVKEIHSIEGPLSSVTTSSMAGHDVQSELPSFTTSDEPSFTSDPVSKLNDESEKISQSNFNLSSSEKSKEASGNHNASLELENDLKGTSLDSDSTSCVVAKLIECVSSYGLVSKQMSLEVISEADENSSNSSDDILPSSQLSGDNTLKIYAARSESVGKINTECKDKPTVNTDSTSGHKNPLKLKLISAASNRTIRTRSHSTLSTKEEHTLPLVVRSSKTKLNQGVKKKLAVVVTKDLLPDALKIPRDVIPDTEEIPPDVIPDTEEIPPDMMPDIKEIPLKVMPGIKEIPLNIVPHTEEIALGVVPDAEEIILDVVPDAKEIALEDASSTQKYHKLDANSTQVNDDKQQASSVSMDVQLDSVKTSVLEDDLPNDIHNHLNVLLNLVDCPHSSTLEAVDSQTNIVHTNDTENHLLNSQEFKSSGSSDANDISNSQKVISKSRKRKIIHDHKKNKKQIKQKFLKPVNEIELSVNSEQSQVPSSTAVELPSLIQCKDDLSPVIPVEMETSKDNNGNSLVTVESDTCFGNSSNNCHENKCVSRLPSDENSVVMPEDDMNKICGPSVQTLSDSRIFSDSAPSICRTETKSVKELSKSKKNNTGEDQLTIKINSPLESKTTVELTPPAIEKSLPPCSPVKANSGAEDIGQSNLNAEMSDIKSGSTPIAISTNSVLNNLLETNSENIISDLCSKPSSISKLKPDSAANDDLGGFADLHPMECDDPEENPTILKESISPEKITSEPRECGLIKNSRIVNEKVSPKKDHQLLKCYELVKKSKLEERVSPKKIHQSIKSDESGKKSTNHEKRVSPKKIHHSELDKTPLTDNVLNSPEAGNESCDNTDNPLYHDACTVVSNDHNSLNGSTPTKTEKKRHKKFIVICKKCQNQEILKSSKKLKICQASENSHGPLTTNETLVSIKMPPSPSPFLAFEKNNLVSTCACLAEMSKIDNSNVLKKDDNSENFLHKKSLKLSRQERKRNCNSVEDGILPSTGPSSNVSNILVPDSRSPTSRIKSLSIIDLPTPVQTNLKKGSFLSLKRSPTSRSEAILQASHNKRLRQDESAKNQKSLSPMMVLEEMRKHAFPSSPKTSKAQPQTLGNSDGSVNELHAENNSEPLPVKSILKKYGQKQAKGSTFVQKKSKKVHFSEPSPEEKYKSRNEGLSFTDRVKLAKEKRMYRKSAKIAKAAQKISSRNNASSNMQCATDLVLQMCSEISAKVDSPSSEPKKDDDDDGMAIGIPTPTGITMNQGMETEPSSLNSAPLEASPSSSVTSRKAEEEEEQEREMIRQDMNRLLSSEQIWNLDLVEVAKWQEAFAKIITHLAEKHIKKTH